MLKLKMLWNKFCIIVIEICIKLSKVISVIMDKCHETLQMYRDMVTSVDEELNKENNSVIVSEDEPKKK
jgi:hypothetical protein